MKRLMRHPWWPWVKRVVGFAFMALVIGLLVRYARTVDWTAVKTSLLELPREVLIRAFVFAAASHFVYSLLDLVGRRYTGHQLSKRRVMQVSFTSYAFNLNLGSLVGGIGLRYRLYSRFGLRPGQITRVVTVSMITNWIGYILVAGLVFTIAPLQLPPHWKLDSEGLRLVGVALLGFSAGYFGLVAFSKTRSFKIRGHIIDLPSLPMALAQHAISCSHWLTMAAVPWTLLQDKVDYPTALSVMLIAAISGVILHIPAGLGVTEAVFIGLLSHRVPDHEILGALLAYRALFYLAPLLLGALMYLKVEARARKQAAVA
ncbi:MAG TPA: lysylphosphatidylglycerol synthase domain-containing protein [Ramlibacter sp.]|nr:lysylphosphatidylglycerol synthase domain-containing protein [Ramlibacter sp.]